MDQGSTRDGVRRSGVAPRQRVQPQALARQALAPRRRYRTPEWLERSFVLPAAGTTTLPTQRVPSHDRLPAEGLAARLGTVRRTPERVDYVALVRRHDRARRMQRVLARLTRRG